MTNSNQYEQVTEDLRLAYDRKAEARDKKIEPVWKETERLDFLHLLQEEGKKTLLEIGAGAGWDSLFFQENGLNVISSDLSPEMVRICREKGLDAYEKDFLNLDFPASSFDAVYARNSLLHVPKELLDDVLGAIKHLLNPGGLFFLGLYGGIEHEGTWERDTHVPKRYFANYTDDQIKTIAKSHFHLRNFKTIETPNTKESGMYFQRLILQKPKDQA